MLFSLRICNAKIQCGVGKNSGFVDSFPVPTEAIKMAKEGDGFHITFKGSLNLITAAF